jgi:hypothetical protein
MNKNEFIPQEGPRGFVRVWRKIVAEPQNFYRELPLSGGFENPLIFLIICALVYFVVRIIVASLPEALNGFFLLTLSYIFGPGILMLACQFLFQGEGDYEATLRACAYSGACLVFAWIPVLGIFVFLYQLYLIFLGVERAHKLDTTRAAIATLVAVLVTGAILFWMLGAERIRRPLL